MPGLIIAGKEVEVPGFKVRNFKDEPKLALRVGRPDGGNDGKRRTLKFAVNTACLLRIWITITPPGLTL